MGIQRKQQSTLIKKLFSPNESWSKSWPYRFAEYLYLENETFNWFYRNVWTNLRVWCENVKRICEWIPILWNDRDWDHAHIFTILKYKLSRTRKCIVGNKIISGHLRVGRQIAYAELLIERIMEDDYCKEEWAQHEAKWGPFCKRKKWTNGQPTGVWRIRQNATDLAKYKQQHAEEMNLYLKENATKDKDKKRLFRHLELYIERWWD